LERGLKQGDELDIIVRDGDEVLATKKMKVIRDV
jgi:bifunctional DNA-binding transcriptional regulator/antitoxin component of YhaV-PrlF toxin-antitoxin module